MLRSALVQRLAGNAAFCTTVMQELQDFTIKCWCNGCAGDLHFYMRHSFQPAPPPEPAAPPAPSKGEAKDLLASLNPLAEIAPTKVLASKVAAAAALLGCTGGKKAAPPASKQSNSASSAASSETDELELGREIYQDLASFVDQGTPS